MKLFKKSLLFNNYLLIITIINLITALFIIGIPKELGKEIGQNPYEIIKLSHKFQLMNSYIDFSAYNAAKETLFILFLNNAYSEKSSSECSNSKAWKLGCFPDIKKEFEVDFIPKMNKYADMYNSYNSGKNKQFFSIQQDGYEVSLIQGIQLNVVGIAKQQKSLAVSTEQIQFFYSNYPNFNAKLDYDLREFNTILEEASKYLDSCDNFFDKTMPDALKPCLRGQKPANWRFKSCDCSGDECLELENGVLQFCVPSKYSFWLYDEITSRYRLTPLQYRFSLDFKTPDEIIS